MVTNVGSAGSGSRCVCARAEVAGKLGESVSGRVAVILEVGSGWSPRSAEELRVEGSSPEGSVAGSAVDSMVGTFCGSRRDLVAGSVAMSSSAGGPPVTGEVSAIVGVADSRGLGVPLVINCG